MDADVYERFKAVVAENHALGRVFNIVLNHLDPDSIGSAYGMKHLLRHHGVPNARIRILIVGTAGENQNERIIDRYGLNQHMLQLEEYWPKVSEQDSFILVDSSNPHDRRLGQVAGKFDPIIVVDHHSNPAPALTESNFIWIERYGSCCAMIVEMIQQASCLAFSKEAGDDCFTAVLLALGIYVDTHDLTVCTANDLKAYVTTYDICDKKDLNSLMVIQKSSSYVAAENFARTHFVKNGLLLVACAGYIPDDRSVYVAKISNEMMTWYGVSVAVVIALTDDQKIIFSVRSSDTTIMSSLGNILKKEFKGSAGIKTSDDGSRLEGGGQISIDMDFAADPAIRDAFIDLAFKNMQRIFHSEVLR